MNQTIGTAITKRRISRLIGLVAGAFTAWAAATRDVHAQDIAPRPRASIDGDVVTVEGLPAISADGREVAWLVPFEASSGAARVEVAFARDGRPAGSLLVLARDDQGLLVPSPRDGRGTSLQARSEALDTLLARGAFVSLSAVLTRNEVGETRYVDDSLRVEQHGRRVRIVQRADGAVVATATLPAMASYCGMSDESPRSVPPSVQRVWRDAASRVVLVEYGHVYASCMCPSRLEYRALALRQGSTSPSHGSGRARRRAPSDGR